MKKEIAQRQIEARNLREDLETRQRQFGLDKKEFEGITEELEKCKVYFFCAIYSEQVSHTTD